MNQNYLTVIIKALKCEYRVIYALMLREVHSIYGNSKLGYLWVLLQDIFMIGAFLAMRLYLKASTPHGMPQHLFLIVGFILWFIIQDCVNKCMAAVSANKSLITFPQVTELDVMISRTLVVFFSYLVIGILILFASTYFVEWTPINDLGGVYLALLASPLLGFSIGVLLSSFAVIFPIINRIVNIVMRFAFFTSGVFFSADRFPQDIQELLLYNPAFQILELARNAFYFGYPTHTSSWTYIFSIIIICLSIGLVMERYVRSRRID